MMVPKTYRDPESETLVTFAFASLGGALAAGAVGTVDASLLLYPVYYCLVNARSRCSSTTAARCSALVAHTPWREQRAARPRAALRPAHLEGGDRGRARAALGAATRHAVAPGLRLDRGDPVR